MPPACVATAAPCSAAPVVLAFFQNSLCVGSRGSSFIGTLAWLRPGFPVQSGFAHCLLYVFCQRRIRAWLIFAFDLLVYGHSPGISHLSEGSISIPTAGVAQRNRCSQNLLTTCVFVARRLQFCSDVIQGYLIPRRCRNVLSNTDPRLRRWRPSALHPFPPIVFLMSRQASS